MDNTGTLLVGDAMVLLLIYIAHRLPSSHIYCHYFIPDCLQASSSDCLCCHRMCA